MRNEKISSGKRGAASELEAAAYLIKEGYEVFRALSPSCSCDLLALKDEEFVRVEVRTATRTKEGFLTCDVRGNYDLLVMVHPDGEIDCL